MPDNLKPGLGTIFSISNNLPATNDVAGYQAGGMVFTAIGEVTEIPEFGPSFDVVTHVPLSTGITAKYHGAKNNGSITVPMGLDPNDAGQVLAKAALASKNRVSFRVAYADGDFDYFQGKIMSFTRGASIGNVVTASVMIEIETDVIEDNN